MKEMLEDEDRCWVCLVSDCWVLLWDSDEKARSTMSPERDKPMHERPETRHPISLALVEYRQAH